MAQNNLEWFRRIGNHIANGPKNDIGRQKDIYALLLNMRQELDFYDLETKDYAMKLSKFARDCAGAMFTLTKKDDFFLLHDDLLLFEAPWNFESYLWYIEKLRADSRKFYLPREKTLKVVVRDLQDLEDRKLDFYGLAMPPRVGKSTICIFFISWIMGKRPNSHNAMSGHSGILADGFYKEINNVIGTPEYTFAKIFPDSKIEARSAEKKEINLGEPDRFSTLTCRGIDGTWTGAVDISPDGYLYVDDLVRDRTESLSPTRLEGRYQDYLNILVDRKNDGSRELMVGTRWNPYDPEGRLEKLFANNPRYRFRKIPALNENNESNFEYDFGKGFSTKYYFDMRSKLDKAEWMAKFQQTPFVREGLLFPEEELRYFDGTIKSQRYRVVAACDPAFGGGDSVSMPICIDNGDKRGTKPVIDWVFNGGSIKITVPRVVDKIIEHDVSEVRIEKNNGGELFADKIKEELSERNYNHCRIICKSAPNKLSKEDKIAAYSDYIKDHFIFLLPNSASSIDESEAEKVYKRSSEYDAAIEELTLFTSEGKNPHDDAPDGLTQLAMIFEDKIEQRPTQIIDSPF